MWSALPWPVEFPPCPLAIVSPPGPAPGPPPSIPQSAPCSPSALGFQTPTPVSKYEVYPSPLRYTSGCVCSLCFPLFPICIISPLWSPGWDLCFGSSGLRQASVIAISCCRAIQSPAQEVDDVSRLYLHWLDKESCCCCYCRVLGGQTLWISSWPTFLRGPFFLRNWHKQHSSRARAEILTETLIRLIQVHVDNSSVMLLF